jgi:hypothetical protein
MSSSPINVPEKLTRPHPFITATRRAATGLKAEEDGRITIGPQPGLIYMVLSRRFLPRALRIVQAVFSEAERRGWEVVSHERSSYDGHAGAALLARGHTYPVEVHEPTETMPFTKQEIEEWRRKRERWPAIYGDRSEPAPQLKRKRAMGVLRLSFPSGYRSGRRSNWTEGVRGPLEDKLERVFEALEERLVEDDRRAEEHARRMEALERERAEREARWQAEQLELERAAQLNEELTAFERSDRIRRYIAALRAGLPDLPAAEAARIEEWCAWAEAWSKRNDPTRDPSLIRGLGQGSGPREPKIPW